MPHICDVHDLIVIRVGFDGEVVAESTLPLDLHEFVPCDAVEPVAAAVDLRDAGGAESGQGEPGMKRFKCNFGHGVKCEVSVSDPPPEKGKSHILGIAWTGQPTLKVMRPYINWMNDVNQTMANEWGVKIMHVYQMSKSWNDAEMWCFEPGKTPQRVVATTL